MVDIAALVALAVSARGAAVKADGCDIADAALLWETPEALRAAVLGLVRPFVPALDLGELERGEQAAFDLLIERCRGEPTCVTADAGIFNALKRLSQNPLKAPRMGDAAVIPEGREGRRRRPQSRDQGRDRG